MKYQKSLLILVSMFFVFFAASCALSKPLPHLSTGTTEQAVSTTATQTNNNPTEVIATEDMSGLLEYRPVPDNGVVFYYDPELWHISEDFSPYEHLVGVDETCEIFDPTYFGHGLSGPANPTPLYIGGRNWIETYGYLYSYRNDFVRMEIRASGSDSNCYPLAYDVFATMKIDGEEFVDETPMPTSTPQPPFICSAAPSQIGYIGAGGTTTTTVRLRSSPEYSDTNTIVKLPENTYFSIISGPKCGDYPGGQYIYWEVEVQQSDGSILQGWLAEGDKNGYYFMIEFGG